MASDQIVISASRRTDIPAFYLNWFMSRLDKGYFRVMNPYNRKMGIIPADPHRVHSIVFWSKNFAEFLSRQIGEQLQDCGYPLYFQFTLNSADPYLEPRIPSVKARLEQMKQLAERFGPTAICWRFDPICYYKIDDSPVLNNLTDFSFIAEHVAAYGVRQCITSFMNLYPKIKRRSNGHADIQLVDPANDLKIETLLKMRAILSSIGIQLTTCCEKKLLETISENPGIKPSSCISNERLVDLFGGYLSYRKDRGQRISQGCQCRISSDVGTYSLQPCYHNCLYCYANPSAMRQPEDL